MLILHTLPRCRWGHLSPSPFCAKVELYLRLLGVPYETRPTLLAQRAPKQKLPWIEVDGQRLADSEHIVAWLRERHHDPLGEGRVPADRRHLLHLARRTVEESLYFVLVAERWKDPAIRGVYARELVSPLPAPLRAGTVLLSTRMLGKQLWQQGYGRHSLDELMAKAADDLAAVDSVLGDAPYFGGERPGAVDASVYGSLDNMVTTPVPTRLGALLQRHPRLGAWLARVDVLAGS